MNKENNPSGYISLLEQAANTTLEGITVSTMSEEDRPLIYANEGFERLTGYTIEEVVGRNCRFLQGDETDEAAVQEIRNAIRKGMECTVELLNYKKDGTPFWNRLSLTPLKNDDGEVTHYVGIQSDITELRETKKRLELANKDLELANKDLELFHKRITSDLYQARKAQQFILPNILPKNNKISFSISHEPMDQIGGDYYDIIEIGEGVFGILIADVTGHGIPAALLTFMTSLAFKNSVQGFTSTEEVVSSTNEKLINKMPKGAFITMFYAIYDSNTRVITYTQAGHPQGIILRPNTNETITLSTGGSLVGVFGNDKITYGEDKKILHPGDKVILYTDAIVETRNKENQMIGIDNLKRFLVSNSDDTISNIVEKIYQFGLEFGGNSSYDDDFTVVGFEVLS